MDARVAESLVRDFAATWKVREGKETRTPLQKLGFTDTDVGGAVGMGAQTGIENINTDVMAYFSNFRNGMEILKQVRKGPPKPIGWALD